MEEISYQPSQLSLFGCDEVTVLIIGVWRLMSVVCCPVVPNVILRLGEFKFTVTCFHSTSSQPKSEFHSCIIIC